MTLILALVGRDNAVLAADAKQNKGDGDALYSSSVEKLQIINGGNWILGVALAQISPDTSKKVTNRLTRISTLASTLIANECANYTKSTGTALSVVCS